MGLYSPRALLALIAGKLVQKIAKLVEFDQGSPMTPEQRASLRLFGNPEHVPQRPDEVIFDWIGQRRISWNTLVAEIQAAQDYVKFPQSYDIK